MWNEKGRSRRLLTAVSVLFALPALAATQEITFTLNDIAVSFRYEPDRHLMISSSCLDKGKFNCQAYDALRTVDEDTLSPSDYVGGAHPGVLLCEKQFKATQVSGKDSTGNANSFCQFKDGSVIDAGSLYYYSLKKNRNLRKGLQGK